LEFMNPCTKKQLVYFESKLSKPTNRAIAALPFKKRTMPHYEYMLNPMEDITIGDYERLRTEKKNGQSKYLTIINDFRSRKRCFVYEVSIQTKSAKAIAHTLNSIIMNHRIRNVAAAYWQGRAVLYLLDP
jgi:hypothetical protein